MLHKPNGLFLSLLDLSPYRLFHPTRVHFVLWAYFDGSKDGKGNQYITLGGIVSSEAIWPQFEKAWMTALESYSLKAFHMTDAMAKENKFLGWTDEAVQKVVKDLVNIILRFTGPEFVLKSCTVQMADYRRLKSDNRYLRRPEAMCVDLCCGTGLPMDSAEPDAPYHKVIFYFDHNEKFLRTVHNNWKNRRKHRGWPSQIQDILAISSDNVPALQAADMVAWTSNGFYKGDDRARRLFPIIQVSGGIHQFYDYERIKEKYGKDKRGVDPLAHTAIN